MERERAHVIVGEFDAGDHDDSAVPGVPVIVADKRALRGAALALGQAGHAEADAGMGIERRRVQDRDPIPTRLHLDR
jgi:hypothetical protein